MSFAERYRTHAFHDLIQEAEKQAIELGVELERERIDEILDGWQVTLCNCDVCKAVREIRKAIKGEQK